MKTLIAFSLAISIVVMPSVCIAEEWWSEGKSITTGLVGMSTEALDGKIYMFGGMFPPVPYYITTVEAYDPEADSWSFMTSMPEDRMNVSLAAVGDSIYVFGGIGGGYVKSTVWKYTPSLEGTPENPWQEDLNPIGFDGISGTEISAGRGVAVSGGKVYIFGGYYATEVTPYVYANWHLYKTVWCYDPADDTWDRKPDLPVKGSFHAIPYGDKIYLIGDALEGQDPPGVFWEYDPSTYAVSMIELPPFAGGETARSASVGTIGDAIYVAGGYKDWTYTVLRASTWKYSFASPEQGWIQLADIFHPVVGAATTTSHGSLYLFGGYSNAGASQWTYHTQVLHVTTPPCIVLDDFEDGVIDTSLWIVGGGKGGFGGCGSGDGQWFNEEKDGYLQARATTPISDNTHGSQAWTRTVQNFNDEKNWLINFKWEADIQNPVPWHADYHLIEITDGRTDWFTCLYIHPTNPSKVLPGTQQLYLSNGVNIGPATWSIYIDYANRTATLYEGPDGSGTVHSVKTLDDALPWYLRFITTTATSAGYPEKDCRINLYDFTAVCEPLEESCWQEQQKLLASDGAGGDVFGYSVGISGNTAIVGAGVWGGDLSGSAYLFDVTTGSQLFKLIASDTAAGDQFGNVVDISGNTAIVGALHDDQTGSAYLFDVTTGTQLFKLTASDAASSDIFGCDVAISGNTAIVGAVGNDDAGSYSGSAYLFDVSNPVEICKLTASDAATGDGFGITVGISDNIAIVGAYSDDDAGTSSGSAYLFDITTGVQLAKLTASDAAAEDQFGYGVGISGNIAIVGAYYDDNEAGINSGSVYLFDVSNPSNPVEITKLTASDAAAGDMFGYRRVEISGNTVIVGAFGNDDAGDQSGSVYLFDVRDPSNPVEITKFTASDAAAGDGFGIAVGISGNTAIVGAYYDDDNGTNSGSAYIFENICNTKPTADAGDDQEVSTGPDGTVEVVLDCSGSEDPDGDELAYTWFMDGNEIATGVNPTIVLPCGTYIIELIVNDGELDSEPDYVEITVMDGTPPEISCPSNVTLECPADTNPSNTGSATATDECDDVPTVTYNDTISGTCPQVIERIWTATDASGNSSTCVQTITVKDTTPPIFTTIPENKTVECDGSGNTAELNAWLADVAASDTCGNATISNDFTNLSDDCGATGSATVTWTAVDECDNSASTSAIFTIVDTTPPEISCPPDVTLECPADTTPAETGQATATDVCSDVTITYSDVSVPGCGNTETITRTWTATDECGNSSNCTQTITVKDTTPPNVTCPPDVTLECPADTTPAETGQATATDVCSDVTITYSDISVAGCGNTQVITRTWMATDECGNSSSCVQTIEVEDTTPPEVTVVIPLADSALQDVVTLTAEASDTCGDVTEVYFYIREPDGASGVPIGQEDLAGILNTETGLWEYDFDTTQLLDGYYVILAKAIDACGNQAWSQIVVEFSIRNWAVIELLPASESNKAGRTMPVKFALRIAESVDPAMPFVYNEGLEIRIYDTEDPTTVLQTSVFGDGATSYRIDSVEELYITNFKTPKEPAEYVVEIWRPSRNFLVGSFTFETVK